MISSRPALLAAVAIWLTGGTFPTPASAAEGGAIRGGEHHGFSRIVLVVEPTTEWSLEVIEGSAILVFPGKMLEFSTIGTFEKLPRSRIADVGIGTENGGTVVSVRLSCDCRVSTAFVGAQYLALDVADRVAAAADPAPPAENETEREAREAGIVASAEDVLRRQIEQAASQGIVHFSTHEARDAAPGGAMPVAAAAPARPAVPAAPWPIEPLSSPGEAPAEAPPEPAPVLQALAEIKQVEARTVFERDGALAAARLAEPALPPACRPDAALDIGAWSDGTPLFAAAPAIASRLVGEFDAPEPEAVTALARLYLRHAFAAETTALLAALPGVADDEALLLDLAAVIDGRQATGPLTAPPCPGAHGFWQILAGGDPGDAERLATAHAAFAALPTDLRSDLGPVVVGKLLDAGWPVEARLFFETAGRTGLSATENQRLMEARLDAAEGKTERAVAVLASLVDAGAPNAEVALVLLTELSVDAEIALPDRMITDLEAALLARRDPELRALLAEALAVRGALGMAMDELDAAQAAAPEAGFERRLTRILASADPAKVGTVAYAEAVLTRASAIDTGPARDGARLAIAGRLLDLGLAEAALGLLGPPLERGEPTARLLAAKTEIWLARPEAAVARLAGIEGPEAAAIRSQAAAAAGDYAGAVAALDAAGRSAEAGPYAWAGGDWPVAVALAQDVERAAMARFMAGEQAAATADPTGLDAPAAFLEPLPGLATPSLSAARRLMATSQQISGFVEGVLADR